MNKDYLVEKWLKNELTEAEQSAFERLDDHQQHLDILETAKNFRAGDNEPIPDFSSFKQQYHKRTASTGNSWLKPLMRVAAILVVGLGAYFIFSNTSTVFQTTAAEKIEVMLPDNSEVVLNSMSVLSFKEKNWNENRSVELDGEAYFKVAKGQRFDVRTNGGLVSVLGTQFNVQNRSGLFEVRCFEGRVEVRSDTLIRVLNAGNTVRILNGALTLGNTASSEPNWINDRSNFELVPYSVVLAEFERQYNLKIEADNVDTNRLFSGGFTHSNLNDALLEITQPMNLTFEQTTEKVILNARGN